MRNDGEAPRYPLLGSFKGRSFPAFLPQPRNYSVAGRFQEFEGSRSSLVRGQWSVVRGQRSYEQRSPKHSLEVLDFGWLI
jgi:hypothetical protein